MCDVVQLFAHVFKKNSKKKYDVIFYNYLDICILNRKDVNHPSTWTCHGGSLYVYYVESTGID